MKKGDVEKRAVIKVVMSADEHDLTRLAAALCRKPMAAFAREAVLAEAERLTSGLKLPPMRTGKGAGKSRRSARS